LKGCSPTGERELGQLAVTYGQPEIQTIEIEGDEYLFPIRLHCPRNRRGEVVLAIEWPDRCVLLHCKG
jgi:hypothetical protein